MGEHSQSLLTSLRTKLGNRRSHSSPPDAGGPRSPPLWNEIPVAYQSVPTYNPPPLPAQYTTRKTSDHQARPLPPTSQPQARYVPQTSQPYARYDPRLYQAANQIPQHRNTVPRTNVRHSTSPVPPPPLLQLPKPRAMWRRSLEELSPSKRNAGWDEPDISTKRMSVNIAAALPPQYFDQPPEYNSLHQAAKEIRSSNPWSDEPMQQYRATHDQRRQNIPVIKTEPPKELHRYYDDPYGHPMGRPQPVRDVTIDNLLEHPMLRPR